MLWYLLSSVPLQRKPPRGFDQTTHSMGNNRPLRQEPQRLLEPGNPTLLMQPSTRVVAAIPDKYSEYLQTGFPLNGGAGSTSSGPNVTSTSKSLSHVLLHKKSMAIPSGSTSHPSCLVQSTDHSQKRGPRGHRSVVLRPRVCVPWT